MAAESAPPPETADAVSQLPPMPNPAHPRNAGPMLTMNANEALRVMRLLSDGAQNGSVDYPYPTSAEYPLPPLPAVPVPSRAGAARRPRQQPSARMPVPILNPPIPSGHILASPMTLDEAIAAHNKLEPPMPASLHYNRSALLVHQPGRGFCWALIRTLVSSAEGGGDARDGMCLTVRYFPTRDPRPPPVHALPPQGPANISSELLTSLNLSVPMLLWRLRQTAGLIDMHCFYCGKHLSDLDGLPMGRVGFLPGEQKEVTDGIVAVDDAGEPEGKWVCWHPRCEQ